MLSRAFSGPCSFWPQLTTIVCVGACSTIGSAAGDASRDAQPTAVRMGRGIASADLTNLPSSS